MFGTKCLHFLGGENQAKPRFGAIGLNAAFAAVLIASTGYFLLWGVYHSYKGEVCIKRVDYIYLDFVFMSRKKIKFSMRTFRLFHYDKEAS